MRWSAKGTKFISTTVLCALILGCSGYKKYDLSGDANWAQLYQQKAGLIQAGSVVKVQTTDGLNLVGSVDLVNELGFELNGQWVNHSSVEFIQVRELLWLPTIVLGAASAFTFYVVTSEPEGVIRQTIPPEHTK